MQSRPIRPNQVDPIPLVRAGAEQQPRPVRRPIGEGDESLQARCDVSWCLGKTIENVELCGIAELACEGDRSAVRGPRGQRSRREGIGADQAPNARIPNPEGVNVFGATWSLGLKQDVARPNRYTSTQEKSPHRGTGEHRGHAHLRCCVARRPSIQLLLASGRSRSL